jgi:hypothetical protein
VGALPTPSANLKLNRKEIIMVILHVAVLVLHLSVLFLARSIPQLSKRS